MSVNIIRLFFLFLSIVCGFYIGSDFSGEISQKAIFGTGIGLIIGAAIIWVEASLKHVSLRNLSAAAFGLIFGFFMSWMVSLILRLLPMSDVQYYTSQIISTLVFCYLGMVVAMKGKDEFNIVIPYVRFSREDSKDQIVLLDTSVIIDGRIISICESGFVQGKLVVPRFVLHELQQVADSSDDDKRIRGRRGLDMLERLKAVNGINVIIHEENLPEIREVDSKLIKLAKMLDCQLITNDFNLSKVAQLEGVQVLNINDLATSLRPMVFPGERMKVHIKREGKEKNQGIGFMDDGTMIVVDNARRFIGRSIEITVTSVLQTSAGKMIFANSKDNANNKAGNDQERRKD